MEAEEGNQGEQRGRDVEITNSETAVWTRKQPYKVGERCEDRTEVGYVGRFEA